MLPRLIAATLLGTVCVFSSAHGRAIAQGGVPTTGFDFDLYSNNVRLLPPLLAEWQLGVATLRGSGVVQNGNFRGTFTHRDEPRNTAYGERSISGSITGGTYEQEGNTRRFMLTVRIDRSSHPREECAPGTTGTLELQDSASLMPNGKTFDYAILGNWSGNCQSHIHGWNNTDGGERTSPSYGGPPDGGQRAAVKIGLRHVVSAAPNGDRMFHLLTPQVLRERSPVDALVRDSQPFDLADRRDFPAPPDPGRSSALETFGAGFTGSIIDWDPEWLLNRPVRWSADRGKLRPGSTLNLPLGGYCLHAEWPGPTAGAGTGRAWTIELDGPPQPAESPSRVTATMEKKEGQPEEHTGGNFIITEPQVVRVSIDSGTGYLIDDRGNKWYGVAGGEIQSGSSWVRLPDVGMEGVFLLPGTYHLQVELPGVTVGGMTTRTASRASGQVEFVGKVASTFTWPRPRVRKLKDRDVSDSRGTAFPCLSPTVPTERTMPTSADMCSLMAPAANDTVEPGRGVAPVCMVLIGGNLNRAMTLSYFGDQACPALEAERTQQAAVYGSADPLDLGDRGFISSVAVGFCRGPYHFVGHLGVTRKTAPRNEYDDMLGRARAIDHRLRDR